ncbi:protein DROOPING LEAF [Magnolia sinica]|uniref:protein DROOPING LEAF n=1 Tax=Magnolia sinica TaxID=86752 RepID=UPI0026588CA1|nr:protein DROOPING LEAF [Magnolia sinica]
MEFAQPPEHVFYVNCNFCNTMLVVGVPCKRFLETVTVKCGHCSNLSFLSTRAMVQNQCPDLQLGCQGFSNDLRRVHHSPSASSTSSQQTIPTIPYIVKPPEKKHRLPSAYNRFMKEEIQRIKAANPDIPHREAFSMAAKNWARNDPNTTHGSAPENEKLVNIIHEHERANGVLLEGVDEVQCVKKDG